jgi:hypothetical protein
VGDKEQEASPCQVHTPAAVVPSGYLPSSWLLSLGARCHWVPEPSMYLAVCLCMKDVGRHEAAILPYRRALALRPHYPEALANLVHSLQVRLSERMAATYLAGWHGGVQFVAR